MTVILAPMAQDVALETLYPTVEYDPGPNGMVHALTIQFI